MPIYYTALSYGSFSHHLSFLSVTPCVCDGRFRKTIYLCEYDTPEKQAAQVTETEVQKLMSSWGYKFEQYMIDGK